MTYLFLGEDSVSKDTKISELKERILISPDALKFDYEILHGYKLESAILKRALVSLPSIAKQRLVVVRECHRLTAQNKEIILKFVKKPHTPTDLILDSNELSLDDSFVKSLGRFVRIVNCSKAERLNVFSLTQAISQHREVEALKILTNLFSKGEHPLQIIGGLVWFWGRSRDRLSLDEFKKGLLALKEADLNIKRSRLNPHHALEMLVVKLCFLEEG
jgi:DNA polymerase III delta subunit